MLNKDAEQIIAEVSAHPNIDELMRRDPRTYTRADRLALAEINREKRAAWISKKKAREEKKDEDATDEDNEEE